MASPTWFEQLHKCNRSAYRTKRKARKAWLRYLRLYRRAHREGTLPHQRCKSTST